MKNILKCCLILVVFPFFCFAETVELVNLTSFVEEFSFHDNRKTLTQDKIYSASKDYSELKGYIVITAYPKNGKGNFKQIALWCDHCGVQAGTPELNQICRDHFAEFYKKLTGKHAEDKLKKLLGSDRKRSQDSASDYDIRFSTGSLKCDGMGGRRARVDFFTR